MTDALETELQHELREVADDASVPPVDVDALLERGRQGLRARRRRTGMVVIAAAAAVAVVVGGVTLVRTYVDTGPGTGKGGQVVTQPPTIGPPTGVHPTGQGRGVASLPHGAAPKLPFWLHGVLHWPGGQARIHYPRLAVGGDRVLVQFQRVPGKSDFTEQLLEGGRLVALPVKSAAAAVISANGQFVAWQVLDGMQTRIVVWRDGVRKSLALPVESACCSGLYPMLSGIDDTGRVYVAQERGWIAWDAMGTGGFQRLANPTGSAFVAAATAFGPEFVDNAGTVYGRMDGGRFVVMGHLPGQDPAWSSDGQMAAWTRYSKDRAGGLIVRNLATGTTSRVPLPVDVAAMEAGWESGAALLVQVVSNGPHPRWYLLRCTIGQASCEVAADLGAANQRALGPVLAR